jgi:aspartyl-tRNA(Asn)/glutamyl-tRNA(Gln) amidotransferase subunit A
MALPTLAETDIDNGPPGTEAKVLAISANTRPFNYLGLPAISIPCGLDANRLPIGLQLAGRPFAEARLLRLADAYQRDTDWHTRRPPVLQAGSGPFGMILA